MKNKKKIFFLRRTSKKISSRDVPPPYQCIKLKGVPISRAIILIAYCEKLQLFLMIKNIRGQNNNNNNNRFIKSFCHKQNLLPLFPPTFKKLIHNNNDNDKWKIRYNIYGNSRNFLLQEKTTERGVSWMLSNVTSLREILIFRVTWREKWGGSGRGGKEE